VWTFRCHPQHILLKEKAAGDIVSLEEKTALMKEIGISTVEVWDFEAVRDFSPEEFCSSIPLEKLQARAVFCGFNFRFGKNGAGDTAFLRSYLEPRGVKVFVEDPVCLDGEVVSSTRIRRLLTEGKPDQVSRMLGRCYTIRFPVKRGKQLGAKLGFPTINQSFPTQYVIPKKGVYAVRVHWDGRAYQGICNIGCRPTVDDGEAITAETHLLDFSGDLYDRTVAVSLHRFLREEKKFDSLEELRCQIAKDREEAWNGEKE
jgi:riboflavin kinase/FMN adenylyltransferase